MFLLLVNFIKTSDEVSKHISSHSAWVEKYFNEEVFLFEGSKKNKLGGIILTKTMDRNLLKKILSEDVFVKEQVAAYQIIDFDYRYLSSKLEFLRTA